MNRKTFSIAMILKWAGLVLALFWTSSALSITPNSEQISTGHTSSVNPVGGGATASAPNQQSRSSDFSADASNNAGTTKKKSSSSSDKKKKRDVTKKKPTNNPAKPIGTTTKSINPASDSMRRIKQEYKDAVKMGIAYDWVRGKRTMSKKPAADAPRSEEYRLICMGPLATNLRHWHFSFRGCGIYEAGIYHGRIILPKNYPLTPPKVQVWTPSGRFVPFANICLSASNYHPESWSPRWTVLSLVQALRLHMLTNPQEIGGVSSNLEDTLEYAKQSLSWRIIFKAGKSRVVVDHAKLQEQGLFAKLEAETGKSSTVSSSLGEISSSDKVVTDDTPGEGTNDDDVAEVGDDDTAGLVETLESSDEDEEQQETGPVSTTKAFEKSPGDAYYVNSMKPKKKSKKTTKLSQSTNQVPASTRTDQRIHAARRENVQKKSHTVVLVLSKVFSSPLRISMISLVFLYWITSFL